MTNPNGSGDPEKPSETSRPKRGGFGEFSELYRARWAASHPHMTRKMPGVEAADPATPADAPLVALGRKMQDDDRSPT